MSRWRLTVVFCCMLAGTTASAQDARVRATLASPDTVWVGQRVLLTVELLAPGYFASAASFDLPDPESMLLMPPTSHPVVGSETIEGVYYTVQRHELAVWPTRAGAQTIPALTIRFAFKASPLDKTVQPASVTTAPVPFTVSLPPGAERLGSVVSARNLTVEESWQPEPGNEPVLAGSAFKRTITFQAPDLPGMVFPPFPSAPADGMRVYSKQRLLDKSDRGTLTGMREDEITYVFERPSAYAIPATRFTWFDLDAQTLRTEDFPARTFDVVANPALASAEATVSAPIERRTWYWLGAALAVVALGVFAALGVRLRRRLARWFAPLRPVHLEPLNPAPRER